jgi:hypothetical protein
VQSIKENQWNWSRLQRRDAYQNSLGVQLHGCNKNNTAKKYLHDQDKLKRQGTWCKSAAASSACFVLSTSAAAASGGKKDNPMAAQAEITDELGN